MDKQKRLNDATRRSSYALRVLVIGGGYEYIKMFHDAGFKGAANIDDADIFCFTGGADVHPMFYGEDALPETYFNEDRDDKEAFIYGYTLDKPKIGICRGAQFLNVMNGGRLWQDVNNHAIGGSHDVTLVKTGEVVSGMTSTHHQQMRPSDKAEIIGVSSLSTLKKSASEVIDRDKPDLDDIEIVWYPESLSFCFQPHPEYGREPCLDLFLSLVDEYILPAC